MASKLAIFVLVSFFLLRAQVSSNTGEPLEQQVSVAAVPVPSPAPFPHIVKDALVECPGVCDGRCLLHSRKNVCHRACMTCCKKCKCVPPGTNGHKELCGTCYTNWTTHGNMTKCP